MSKKELAEELQRPLIKKFNKRIIHSFVVDYIWSAGVTDTQLISKFSKEIRFLLCVIYIFNKYKWIIPLEDKKGIKTNNAFQKFSKESNCKPNKYEQIKAVDSTIDQMNSFLLNNIIERYSAHNERKSVDSERFIRTLKNKIY